MITETEGIVLRQVKALGGRRMISLFSKNYGKISVGTSLNEGGKNKTALAIKAFSYGRYQLFKNRENYNLNNGQVVKSYYSIGENLDKYMAASYVLELTDKVLPEDLPQPKIFNLLADFLEAMEKREKKHGTLVTAYIVKMMDYLGAMPQLGECACCGGTVIKEGQNKVLFSIEEGGVICPSCDREKLNECQRPLIYREDIGIIDILKYFQKQPMEAFERIALDEAKEKVLQGILREYISYHLDIKELKSESFFQI